MLSQIVSDFMLVYHMFEELRINENALCNFETYIIYLILFTSNKF